MDQQTGEVDGYGASVSFIASLPPIQGAIRFDGQGDGGRIQLDVSRDGLGALLHIAAFFTGAPLRVTIEAATDER